MSAAKLNLPTIEQGATYRHTLFWKDNASVPIDLTGCAARMQIRATVDSPVVICELSTVNARIVITPISGRIDLIILSSISKAIKALSAVYDLEITFSNGDVIRLIEGSIIIKARVTRP